MTTYTIQKLILISGFCDDVMHNLEDDDRASHHGDTRMLHVLLCYNYLFSFTFNTPKLLGEVTYCGMSFFSSSNSLQQENGEKYTKDLKHKLNASQLE